MNEVQNDHGPFVAVMRQAELYLCANREQSDEHSMNLRWAVPVIGVMFLTACGGGSSNLARSELTSNGPQQPESELESPSDSNSSTVLERYQNYLNGRDSIDAWPKVGDYTHHFNFLFGDAVGDGLHTIAPTNISCQEESCWTSEESANSLGTVTGIQRAIEHANVPVYRLRGENTSVGEIAYDTWGVWLEFTAFSVSRLCDIGGECQAGNTSLGVSGSPSGSIPSGVGSASWVGVVTAVDTDTHNLILGDARVVIDDLAAAAPQVDVALTGLWDVDAGVARADIRWVDLPVSDGSSSVSVPGVAALPAGSFGGGHAPFGFGLVEGGTAGDDYMIGQFFGDGHQEVAGKFVHSSTQTAGAFGGKRR